MKLLSLQLALLGLTQIVRHSASVLSPRTESGAPAREGCVRRHPWMHNRRPGARDVLGFAYEIDEPGTDDVVGPREP